MSALFDVTQRKRLREVHAVVAALAPPVPLVAVRPCSECGMEIRPDAEPRAMTCSKACGYLRRIRVQRSRRTPRIGDSSRRLLVVSREVQDRRIADFCADWRERARRVAVGRLGVRR